MILLLLALLSADPSSPEWIAPDGRSVSQLIRDHVLPDPAVTRCADPVEPDCVNPDVTPETIRNTVCRSGWTATVRPPVAYTNKLKAQDTPPGEKMADGELDHLLSIEDSGLPADPRNLWWMKYSDVYGARVKDVLETKLKRFVCAGKITLQQARDALVPNWLVGYQTYVGPLPHEAK